MMTKLKNWLVKRISGDEEILPQPRSLQPRKVEPRPKPPRPKPAPQNVETGLADSIENRGPGKNVLVRTKYVREETATHETLKILDDSLIESGEEPGIDPYNTGGFDRSKNWAKRFRK